MEEYGRGYRREETGGARQGNTMEGATQREYRSVVDRGVIIKKEPAVRGWLKFFLIIMGIGAVLSLVLHAIRFNIYAYYIGMGHWMTVLGAVSDWLLFAGLCVLAGYAILSFIGKRPNSVALARAYLIIVLSVNLLNLLSGLLAGFPPDILLAVRGIAWGIIWLVFLSMSTQVKELIAPGTRKMYAWDIVLLAIICLPAVMYIGIGFMNRLIQSFA